MSHSSVKSPPAYEELCRDGNTENTPRTSSASGSGRIKSQVTTAVGSRRIIRISPVDKARSTTEQTTDEGTLSPNSKGASQAQPPSTNGKLHSSSHQSTRLRRTPTGLLATQPTCKAAPAIHKLPLEILIQIFRSSIEAEKGAGWLSQDRVLKLSVVCRHWRSVVYNTPSLWSTISSYYQPTRLKKALELSKGHLLDVHWMMELFGSSSTSFKSVLTQSSRWRSFQGRMSAQNFATLSRNTSPNLGELDLVLGEVRSSSRATRQPLNNIRLFQGSLTCLRHLKLQWTAQRFTFDWGSMVFPALESLHLTTASAAPSSAQLLEFLSRSSRVREIELNLPNESESPQPVNDQEAAEVVQVHSLERFHLMSNSSYASNVLSRLRPPSSTLMDITVNLDAKEPYPTSIIQHVAPQLVSAATQVASASRPAERPKIDLLLDYQSIVLQVSQNPPRTKNKKDSVERPLFHLRIFGTNPPGAERALEGLRTALSMTNTIDPEITLDVTFDKIGPADSSTCFEAVARLPRVTTIQIGVTEGSTAGNVDQFLKFISQARPGSLAPSWPLTEMERLTICDADPNLIAETVRLRYRGFVGGRKVGASGSRKLPEMKPLKSLTAFWKNRVAGEYESLKDPVARVLGVNRVLWWYDSGMKGVWQ